MALENLTPVTRMESILNGDDVAPVTREEYFWKQAAGGSGGGSELPEYTAADAGKVLTVENPTETVVIASEQTFTAENGYGQMSVDFSSVRVGDPAVVNGTVAGQPVTINMLAVEYQDKMYLIDAQYTEYDPTHGYLSEDGEFYNPNMASIPQVSITAGVTATKTLDPTPVWGTGSHTALFYSNTGSYLEGITAKEAYELFTAGNIIFTIDTINGRGLIILTKISRSQEKYTVYWNFSTTATGNPLDDDDLVPIAAFQ